MTAGDPYAPITSAQAREVPTRPKSLAGIPTAATVDALLDAEADAVVTRNRADVLEWVGDEPSRARRALAAELRRGQPRVSVVGRLTTIVGD